MLNLRSLHYYIDVVVPSLSLVANFLLLVLIIFRTPPGLKPYSRILLQTCLLDSFLASVTFFTKLQIELDNGVFIMLLSGFLAKIPHPLNFLLILLMVFALYFCIIALPIPFYFRYLIICKEHVLSWFWFTFLYFIAALFALSYTIFAAFAFAPNEQQNERYLQIMGEPFWLDENGQPPIFVAADITSPLLLGMLFYASILSGTTYALILYLLQKIRKKLSYKKGIMSNKTQSMHKQLNYALIIQALIPLFTGILPIIFVIISIFLRLQISGTGLIVMMSLSLITFLNPLIVILVVAPYRRSLFCGWKQKDTHVINDSANKNQGKR